MKQQYNLNQISEPSTISFHSMNTEWVMRITADRRIEVAEGVDVTEAARLVLDAMQGMLDVGLEKAVLAEREACAKIADSQLFNTNALLTAPMQSSAAYQIGVSIRARGQA